jgi:hypothetical protein
MSRGPRKLGAVAFTVLMVTSMMVSGVGATALASATTQADSETSATAPAVSIPSEGAVQPGQEVRPPVNYNATGQVGNASDLALYIRNDTDGSLLATNSSLGAVKGLTTATIPSDTIFSNTTLRFELVNASNNNETLATDTALLIIDGSSPETVDATAIDPDDDGNVSDGDTVEVRATVTDPGGSGVARVWMEADQFGGPAEKNLTRISGTNTYNSTFTVDESAASSSGVSAGISVLARDAAGNMNGSSTNDLTLTTSTSDSGGASGSDSGPVLSNAQANAATPSDGVTAGETIEIRVNVSSSGSADVASVTANMERFGGSDQVDLTQVGSSEVYNTTFQVDADSASINGEYEVLIIASDTEGNFSQTETQPLTLNISGNSFDVVSKDVSVVSGPSLNGQAKLDIEYEAGLIQVRLETGTGQSDLEAIGADDSTEFELNMTLNGTTPRVLLGAGQDLTWTRERTASGNWTVSIHVRPIGTQRVDSPPDTWSGSTQATISNNQTVSLAIDTLGALPESQRTLLNGSIYGTDAQSFSTPEYNQQTETVSVEVGAPHFTTSGANNTGYFETVLPNALLTDWGVSDASDISVSSLGSSVDPATAENVPAGVRLAISGIHYSEGEVEFSPSSSSGTTDPADPTLSDATLTESDDDGIVQPDDTVTLSVNATNVESVSVDASAFGAGTVNLTESSGQYEGTFQPDRTQAAGDGTYSLTITGTASDGDTAQIETDTVEMDLWDPAENQVLNATESIDVWEKSIFPLRADESPAAIQVENADWFGSLETDGSSVGSQTLNKDTIAVYNTGTDIPVSFDNERAVAGTQFTYTNDQLDVQLIAARVDGQADGSNALTSVGTVEEMRELLTQENANENATFEVVDSTQLNSDGDATFDPFTPSDPGQYVLFAATNESGGFTVDAEGDISLAGQTTIIGVDQVAVQRSNSTVAPESQQFNTGDDVEFTAQTSDVIQRVDGENVTHVMLLYDEETYTQQDFTIVVNGSIN